MILSENDKIELIKCSAGLISNEELNHLVTTKADLIEFQELLESVYNSGNHSLFEAVLWCMPNRLVSSELELLYSKFIVLRNHREHENIARQFQLEFNNNIKNIKVLLNAINELPDYLSPDDFKYSYIRKLIYAIGAQPEPNNIEALEKLVNETNDEQVKELALHQIKKRKELGRWEAVKNQQ